MAARTAPALLVVDEGLIEFAPFESAAALIGEHPNLVVLRSLSLAYGLAGARVGAAIAAPETLARLAAMLEPWALPAPLVRLAMQALDPSRMIETAQRIDAVKAERARLVRELARITVVEPGFGPVIIARPDDIPTPSAPRSTPTASPRPRRASACACRSPSSRRSTTGCWPPSVSTRPAPVPPDAARPCATRRRRASSAPSIWTPPRPWPSRPASASSTT